MEQHNNPNQQQPQQQTVIVVGSGNQKSVGLAFLLAFLFGPLGLLYASVTGGIVMFILTGIIGIITLGIGFVLGWIGSIIWAVVAVNNHNKKVAGQTPFVHTQSAPSYQQQQPVAPTGGQQAVKTSEQSADTTQYQWFYAANDQSAGPVSTGQLTEMFSSKTLSPQTLVWRDGLANWTEASTLEQFASVFAPVAAPTPPPLFAQKLASPPELPTAPSPPVVEPPPPPPPVAQEPSPLPPTPKAMAMNTETVSQTFPIDEAKIDSNFISKYKIYLLAGGGILICAALGFYFLKDGLLSKSDEVVLLGDGDNEVAPQPNHSEVIYAVVEDLRVRENPDLNAKVIDGLKEGETAKYFGEKTSFTTVSSLRGINYNEPWYKVQTSRGKIGWVYGGGVKIGTKSENASFTAVINDPDGYTNIRKQPDSNSDIVGRVTVNQPFTVLSTDGNWWQVRAQDGTLGYMHKSRITPGNYPEGSTRILQPSDISGKSKNELRIIRNEIFARHGYLFKSDDLRDHFGNQPWYIGRHTDVNNQLSAIEKQNIEFLKRYEN